ncbi:hypothetical protein EBL89_11145 [Cereibacter sphaeroides]|nr:hypothetical protein EBL89_11145 [Cereibacter sphaeroides]AZB60110.1 hypothetical protein EBL88_11090 [Cereibacter sphaeroides]
MGRRFFCQGRESRLSASFSDKCPPPPEDELVRDVRDVLAAEGLAVVKWQAPPFCPDQIQ